MSESKRALFHISLKILLRDGEKVLLLKAQEGDIDLPGGRIDIGEENISLPSVIVREVNEELGKNLQFRLGDQLFTCTVFGHNESYWIFTIVYDAEYISGDIILSDEHASYEWVDPRSYELKRENFFPQDEEKYQAFKRCFSLLANG
ncbi:MAG: NUDIX hydrolase [bacterium]|nr:NUDIX hydrolase [bacterium]